uniref:Uncharacterized protein n=1 Tax=Populus trichocarpa TaxID=3694 RepID=A0A2K1WP08_POPTR
MVAAGGGDDGGQPGVAWMLVGGCGSRGQQLFSLPLCRGVAPSLSFLCFLCQRCSSLSTAASWRCRW